MMLQIDEDSRTFETFCGSELWNTTLTWNTVNGSIPDFTRCFQHTLVSWIPCGFLWISLPFYLYYLSCQKAEYVQKLTAYTATKSILALLLAALSLFDLGYSVAVRYYNKDVDSYLFIPPAAYVSYSLDIISMLAAAVLIQRYRQRGHFSSGVLWFYWGLWAIFSAVPFYSEIVHFIDVDKVDDIPEFVTRTTYFTLCVIQFVLSSISDANAETRERYSNTCPEVICSFSSYIYYSWFSPLVSIGYSKDLLREDLWTLPSDDMNKNHVPAFEADWNRAVAQWRNQKENISRYSSFSGEDDGTEPMIEPLSTVKEPSLSIVSIIAKHYGGTLMAGFACKFVYDWLQFVGPILQSLLIEFVASRTNEAEPGTAVAPAWQGYIYAIALLISQFIMTFLLQMMWYLCLKVGYRVRASIISIIYKKSLRMNSEAKQESTVGEIVNLMSVDAQRMQDVFQYLWMIWSAPLQICIAVWQLYITVGPSLFVGFGLLVITLPLTAFIALKQRSIQGAQMKIKDERIKIMNEVLGGIKVIKLYAWEPSFEEKIAVIRRNEMKSISENWTYIVANFSIFSIMPTVVTAATFAVYVLVEPDHILSPTAAFVTLSLFNILRQPLFQLPLSISFTVMANVSVQRIQNLFKNTDLSNDNVEKDDNCGLESSDCSDINSCTAHKDRSSNSSKDVSLRITDGTFSWLPNTTKILRNINLEVPTGSLTAVVGQVGCGKSSLLAACVGDMHKHSGKVVTKGSVAFSAQQAWIQNATVRDNILFGHPYDQEKYDKIVDAVALGPDFKILDDGDQTWIGEKGINLSGGQKQRISLARACYSDCDLYLLDDPLSAVDAHVGKHIFENVVGPNGILKDKTRILVTHGIQWLPEADNVAVMSNSRISETGTYQSLLEQKGAFAQFVNTHVLNDPPKEESDGVSGQNGQHLSKIPSVSQLEASQRSIVGPELPMRQLSISAMFSMSFHHAEQESTQTTTQIPHDTFQDQETAESGNIGFRVYVLYAKAMGYGMLSLTSLAMLGAAIMIVFENVWLSAWTDDPKFSPVNIDIYTDEEVYDATIYYLVVYCVVTIIHSVMNTSISYTFSRCSISASKNLHNILLRNIMRAQMIFFDTKPLGQILNRFSKDVDAVDNLMGVFVLAMAFTSTTVVSTLIVIIYSTPVFLIMAIPLAIMYAVLQRYFICTARQLKRQEAITRSPIFTHFSETVTGAGTIRAFGVQDRFIQKSEDMVEENVLFFFAGWVSVRWLSVRSQTLSAFVVGLVAIFCVMSTQISALNINSSLVGLCLSNALIITRSLDMLTKNLTDLETNVVSVERIKEYSEVPLEASWIDDDDAPPRQWPAKGQIQFRRYATRYRPELDLVLKDLDITVKPQEKVGIVGRTGAGKSSMTLSLFRLIEAARGSIYIDGVNIGAIGLHQLRNKITILPQDPLLFSGGVRENLDPFHQYSDDKIWEVLEQSYLKEYVERQPEKLGYECGEGGENLSVGQRQLICLARALLRKTKILVLDEATAAVDLETDNLIQQTIRTAFAECTILTIAHRLKTIMDSDRILVLHKGRVAEFDTPENLLDNSDGIFYGMVKETEMKSQ